MPHSKHIIIIGGGAIGLCTAYYLNKTGHRVTVFEKEDYNQGASIGNAGMLVPSHVVPLAAPGVISQGVRWLLKRDSPFRIKPRLDLSLAIWLWQFRRFCNDQHAQASMPLLRDLSLASVELFEALSTRFSFQLERRGLLMIHSTARGKKENLKYGELAKKTGLDVEVLEGDSLRNLEPGISTNAVGAVYYPQDAHMNPALFINELYSYLTSEGVDCRTQTAVTGFTQRHNKIVAVKTSSGEFEADEVILAAGSWSPALGRMLGLELPIQPAKGYSVTMQAPADAPKIPMILTEAKVTITPMGSQLRFGGTLELGGYDSSVDRVRATSILNTIPDYLPAVNTESIKTENIWSGYRPCTPDGLPMIGRSKLLDNLIIASGHAMIGITLAPITGQLVTTLINEKNPTINIAALYPERFASRLQPLATNPSPDAVPTDAS